MAGGRIEVGDAGLAAIYAHADSLCTLARYEAHPETVALQEQTFPLRTAFALLTDDAVQCYKELVGYRLADALMLDLNAEANANRWHIKISGNGVADTHTFSTPDAAASAYRVLIRGLIEHMAVVIGVRLARAVVLETAGKLDPRVQQTLQTYSMVPAAMLSLAPSWMEQASSPGR